MINLWYPWNNLLPRRTADGTYSCRTPRGEPDHRLHQSRGSRQNISFCDGEIGIGYGRQRQYSPKGFAGTCCGLLCDCVGALYAVLLSRGIALPLGGDSMVVESNRQNQGRREVGNFAGADQIGGGAVAATARRGGPTYRRAGNPRGVVSRLACGELGRQHPGC